jgi:uncharacterized protein (DUF58 family)
MSDEPRDLLDPAFLRRLDRLRVEARRAFPGTTKGERRSTRRGASVEFADFREYAPGDDLRHLDWSVYARLDRLVIRLFVEEEDVRIDILVDASPSMGFGEPMTKFDYAKRVAAALGYLAVSSLDRIGVAAFAERIGPRLRAARGRGQLIALLRFLGALETVTGGTTNLAASLDRYARETTRPGVLFVISDFLDGSDYVRTLTKLAFRRFDVNLIQVLAPDEAEPPLGGDLVLVDSETGQQREVTVNAATAIAYKRALESLRQRLASLGPSAGVVFHATTTDVPFEDLLLRHLRRRRLVRAS